MTGFNPELFLAAETSEVNTRRPAIPMENPAAPDGLYMAVITDVKMAGGISDKPGDNFGKPWLQAQVTVKVQVPQQVQDGLGITLKEGTVTLTERPFIALTEAGTIDNSVGKNPRQKAYREALDMNKPGDVWSWAKAIGQPIKVKIKHEMYEGNIQEKLGIILRAS